MNLRAHTCAFLVLLATGAVASEQPSQGASAAELAEIQAQRQQLLEELARIRRALDESDARIEHSRQRIQQLREQLPAR